VTTHTQKIGPYTVQEEIGRGGMGVVYRAVQPSLNRVIALKVLPPACENDREKVVRFQQEAQAAAKLSHPNIVKVWEASIYEAPYYIAMEYLDGGTLADRLQHGPLPAAEAVRITQSLCSALDHAHSHGVIHRDVKPENIMFDAAGRPVIMDFGIAKAAGRAAVTMDGTRMGTPDYMSPEQAKGLALTNLSDLYSLAMVFYEMLTGHPPFSNADPLVTMRQVIDQPIPPPRHLNPAVPLAIEGVLMKALAKRPESRYQNGNAFAEALKQTVLETARPKRSNRRLLLALLFAVVLISLAIVTKALIGDRVKVDPDPPLTVPNLIGMLETEANKIAGKDWVITSSKKPSEKHVGTIIEQLPAAGSRGSKGATITIAVSSGPEPPKPLPPTAVPNFVGMAWDAAYYAATQNRLGIAKGASKESSQDKGVICGQDKPAGARVKQGTTIHVTISLGPKPPEKIMVPDVYDEEAATGKSILRGKGFRVVGGDKGIVKYTSPGKGQRAVKGSVVVIYVKTIPPPVQCNVCGKRLPADQLKNHLDTNHYRCQKCGRYMTKDALMSHEGECKGSQ